MSAEWIRRLADDERARDDARSRATEAAARKAHLVARHGQRVLDELRAAIARDVEAFRDEFPGDKTREILLETMSPDEGFVVRKPAHPSAMLSVVPSFAAASVRCQYRFRPTDGLPPREDRIEFAFNSGRDDTLQLKQLGTGQVFTSADALSEYLLVPVLTGRPR